LHEPKKNIPIEIRKSIVIYLLRIYVEKPHDYLNQYQNKSFYFQHEHIDFQVIQLVLKMKQYEKVYLGFKILVVGFCFRDRYNKKSHLPIAGGDSILSKINEK
jgi:hypothetical protein